MTEKRFRKGESILTDFPTGAIIDEKTGERYYDGIKPSYISSKELVKILNGLYEENKKLKELIKLIANADSTREETSVKEILRNEIWGIDSVTGEYSSAWHDYVILSNFFKKHYGEHWDNDKFD